MKQFICIFLTVVLSTGILISCKKENTKENTKDYSVSIKDKTWWGRLTYSGQTTEYYCVHFRSDGSLLWSQLSGDYLGSWVVKDKQLVMNFDASGAEIKADISEDEKLTNITDNASSYKVNSGQIISNSNTSLDNTEWKGTISPPNNITYSMKLNFLTGAKVVLSYESGSYPPYSYTRSESGAVIRTTIYGIYHFFCILTSSTEMKGSNTTADSPFQTTKQ